MSEDWIVGVMPKEWPKWKCVVIADSIRAEMLRRWPKEFKCLSGKKDCVCEHCMYNQALSDARKALE